MARPGACAWHRAADRFRRGRFETRGRRWPSAPARRRQRGGCRRALVPAGQGATTAWLGWASGSGDGNNDDGVDSAFRQTGLQENKGRFGGVKRFHYYGELFRPELSNLAIGSLGLSMRFFENSSVDLVLHSYRQRHASRRLADSRLDRNPTGNNRDLGRELDLVLAFRESEQFEFVTSLGAFRAGSAFGPQRGEMAYYIELGMTINF